jgi:two-component system, chemotaxis family, chemotaxis protein CheY
MGQEFAAQTTSPKTVLLVEDDVEIRDILQDLLEAEGYDVIPASHGRQALEFLQASRETKLPNLVVLDLMMPLVDGSEVLRAMKQDAALADIPVVVLSAVARERPAGAAAFLRKPVPLQKLFDTIRGFVEHGVPQHLAAT